MPVAYRIPISPDCAKELDQLALRKYQNKAVPCGLNCGVTYALVYPATVANHSIVDRYVRSLLSAIGECGNHPSKVEFALDAED